MNSFDVFHNNNNIARRARARSSVAAAAVTESLLGATEGVSCRVRGRNDEITKILVLIYTCICV